MYRSIPKRICSKSWTKHNTLCGQPSMWWSFWLLFIWKSCDIWWQTDIKAAVTDTSTAGFPVSVSVIHAWQSDCAESAGRSRRGNLVISAGQRSAGWPGSAADYGLTAIHHSCWHGRMLLRILSAHPLTPLWSAGTAYTLITFPIQTSGQTKSLMIHWALSFCVVKIRLASSSD